MNLKRTMGMVVGGAALAAWLSASITPGRPPLKTAAIAPAPIDASGAALASEVARLRERLRPGPAPSAARRNLFAFQSARFQPPPTSLSASFQAPPNPSDLSAAGTAIGTVGLRLKLAGIAEDPDPAGGAPIRTAIVAGNGQLFLAREGDAIADGGVVYKVGAVSDHEVQLTDTGDGTIHRLALK